MIISRTEKYLAQLHYIPVLFLAIEESKSLIKNYLHLHSSYKWVHEKNN